MQVHGSVCMAVAVLCMEQRVCSCSHERTPCSQPVGSLVSRGFQPSRSSLKASVCTFACTVSWSHIGPLDFKASAVSDGPCATLASLDWLMWLVHIVFVPQVTPNDEVRGMVATGANALPNAVVQRAFKVGNWLACSVQCWRPCRPCAQLSKQWMVSWGRVAPMLWKDALAADSSGWQDGEDATMSLTQIPSHATSTHSIVAVTAHRPTKGPSHVMSAGGVLNKTRCPAAAGPVWPHAQLCGVQARCC